MIQPQMLSEGTGAESWNEEGIRPFRSNSCVMDKIEIVTQTTTQPSIMVCFFMGVEAYILNI